MPSTACSCIGELSPHRWDVILVDPSCRVHREPVAAGVADPGTDLRD